MKKVVVWMLSVMAGASCLAAEKGKATITWAEQIFSNVVYKEVDGRKLQMDIYMPPGAKPENAPVIYFVHGGGWAAGNKEKFGNKNIFPVCRQLADKGFVCVSVSYRLCRGNSGIVMRDCVVDAKDGLRFLKKNAAEYGIDPNRIVVFGESAGAHIIQMLTFTAPDEFIGDTVLSKYGVRPVAGISWYGPTDFTDVNMFKTDLSDKDPNRFGNRITGGKGDYATNPQAYEEMSPVFWIKKDSPPLLLMQGNTDATIPYAHAPHLKKKADKIGADVEMIIVDHAGHNWRKAGGTPSPSVAEIQQISVAFALSQTDTVKTED